jgi:UDP-galactopyranose mutase
MVYKIMVKFGNQDYSPVGESYSDKKTANNELKKYKKLDKQLYKKGKINRLGEYKLVDVDKFV